MHPESGRHQCRTCTAARVLQHYYANIHNPEWREQRLAKHREYVRKRAETDPVFLAKKREYARRYAAARRARERLAREARNQTP